MSLRRILTVTLLLFCPLAFFAQSAKKLYKAGLKDEKAGKYDAAVLAFSGALTQKPGNYDYLMARARTYEKQKKRSEAVKDYTDALNVHFKSIPLHLKVIDLDVALGRYAEGLDISERLLTLDKWDIDGLGRKALCLIMLHRFAEAQATCDRAMEKSIYNYALHYYKGLAQDSLKDYPAAIQSYTKAIRLMRTLDANSKKPQPQYKPYYYNIAVAQYRTGQFDESLKNIDQALEMDPADSVAPKNFNVLYWRSFPDYSKNDFNTAVNDLNRAIVLSPQEKFLFMRRASIYRATSQFQSAISDYTKALLLDDKDAANYGERGLCYMELADYKNAVDDLAKSIQLRPHNNVIAQALETARKKLYEANRESDPPTLKIEYPIADNAGFINAFVNQEDLLIEGEVRDRSALEWIHINGVNAELKTEDKISSYSCKVPLTGDVRRIDIVARDVYNNETSKTLKVGRIVDESRAKVTFAGKLLADDQYRTPYSNRMVYLTNEKGEILYSAKTDLTGSFTFKELPYDRTYLVKMDASDMLSLDPNLKRFMLTNDKGNPVAYADASGKGKFTYRLLASDPTVMQEMMLVDDAPLRIDMSGRLLGGNDKSTPIGDVNVLLMNDRSETVSTQKTDASGTFRFSNLPPGDNYSIRIADDEAKKISYNRIVLTDEHGHVLKEIERDGKGEFVYHLLAAERTMLTSIAQTDPWLKTLRLDRDHKELVIIENIYYESGAWAILPDAEKVLQKAIDALKANPALVLEVQSHTDAVAGDDFNMELSQKRANAVVDYLVSKGIDKKRLTAKGFGETQLINHCTNGVECSDAEHRQNRRTVFKLDYNGK